MTDWFVKSFGEDYLRIYRARSAEQGVREVDFLLERLRLPPESRALDLCCGAGRHLCPLRERGVDAVGFDLSAPLLEEARKACGPVPLVRGDMRELPFEASSFRAVFSFFTSFGYFEFDPENERVLSEVGRVTERGGDYVIDHMDRESTISGLVPESDTERGGVRVQARRWISQDGRRVEKETIYRSSGRDDQRYFESVRLYSREELSALLAANGFDVETVWGDFEGATHVPGDSKRMIFWAKKR